MSATAAERGTVYLAATGTALPGAPVDNTALAALLGISEEWIDLFVGTKTRHFGWDPATGEVRGTLADLCTEAAAQAMDGCGFGPADIEFLILATATPDTLLPTTAGEVADRLGLGHLPVFQIQAGCSGAIQAIDLGRTLVRGGHRAGLVVGGDVTHRFLSATPEAARMPREELVNYVLFGDGAGAAVLTDEPEGERVAVRAVLNSWTGQGRPPGQLLDWYGTTDRDSGRPMLAEDYKAIEEHVPTITAEILWELLGGLGWDLDDIGFLLPPQLSERMTARIVEGLPATSAREVSCVSETGNTGNALPFHQLDRLLPDFTPGSRALALCVESSRWFRAGLALEKV
ncbi:3-oxoacyl-[acyl-carrier-protein] synthase III [Streptomyces cirratus]|uniref:3-oxoacyl-[acyl-carrier-protein] synthase III n=1 Tax=Streptomyces cirratus TaxID=68187 RepID=A0ABQ3F4A7_9ACTN|nr:3-oxoacyl-ACP synthase III family protein [Streptomyces cirratus]GHB74842.1 3-oxoacyl-[acyl-carrier-protein] synthase III [Streptomyces cirratus]